MLVVSRRPRVVTDRDAKLCGFYFDCSQQDLYNEVGETKFGSVPGGEVVCDQVF